MAAAKRRLFSAFRISRKLILITGGFLVLLGASGTATLLFGGGFHFSKGETADMASGSCKTIYTSKFLRSGERRLVAVIRADDEKPAHRVQTGLRIARFLSESEKPDLVTIQMADMHGPESRIDIRGPMIGTEIVYAPNPNRSRATNRVWEVRYIDAKPSRMGYYFGQKISLPEDEIETVLREVEPFHGCDGDLVETAALDSGHGESSGHAEDVAGHGDEKAAADDGHGSSGH
ncbi:hypothetical protein E2A64_14845 [Pseudohoeflea suaedae]|uniref:Uncharacterized protein n=1 Tax=Pseudohoeflea suaedae TaxID=877384 RepID=A0A4R5PJE3_9HYPH|nr:hypothetical protein [Pseudohoeflea suaedae]TDH34994.1 hypothetical protein E2A64_14845 [Pseudohoeflea suaedae]